MSEARKRQAKIWTLVDTDDMNADELMESIEKDATREHYRRENNVIFTSILIVSKASACVTRACRTIQYDVVP